MNDRGKRIAGWSAGLVALALVVTGFVGGRTAVEYWYLYKLESQNEAEKTAAAETLLRMESVTAAPQVLRAFAESDDFERWISTFQGTLFPLNV